MDLWPRRDSLADVYDAAEQSASVGDVRVFEEYQDRPIDFIVEQLGVPRETLVWSMNDYGSHKWDGTVDPLVKIMEALADWQDVGVESDTGTGKSFLGACIIPWFMACFRGARVFTFAPKEDQLRLYIWMEIGKLWPRFKALFPSASLTDLRVRMDNTDDWGAWGYAVGVKAGEESATNAQGMHAEHMLLVYEEMPGIPKPVVAAGENTCTAPHNLRMALGNPDNVADTLHEFCLSPGVVHVRVSAEDHPNVVTDRNIVPGAVSRKAIERRKRKYGEDSQIYRSRVRGISPTESAFALIKKAWLDKAVARYSDERLRVGLRALGVDVADSEAGDKAAIARGIGACLLEVPDFPCPDSNVLGTNVAAEMKADGVLSKHVGVDGVGVGAGTVNELKRLKYYVQSLKGGAVAEIDEDVRREEDKTVVQEEVYISLRAQMWWQFRRDVQYDRIAIPDDPELIRDLLTPTWTTRGGKIVVEAKEDIVKRLGHSPNKGDAAVYWNWVRPREALPEPEEKPDPNYDTGFDKVVEQKNKQRLKLQKLINKRLREVKKK